MIEHLKFRSTNISWSLPPKTWEFLDFRCGFQLNGKESRRRFSGSDNGWWSPNIGLYLHRCKVCAWAVMLLFILFGCSQLCSCHQCSWTVWKTCPWRGYKNTKSGVTDDVCRAYCLVCEFLMQAFAHPCLVAACLTARWSVIVLWMGVSIVDGLFHAQSSSHQRFLKQVYQRDGYTKSKIKCQCVCNYF